VIFQSSLAYTDVACLFAVTLAAALLVKAVRAAELSRALVRGAMGGALVGFALGAKYAALPLAAALALPLAVWSFAPDGRIARAHAGRAVLLALVAGASALVPSWFWYARNLRLTGNPLFPIAVPLLRLRGLFGATAFNPGKSLEFASASWKWAVYPWIERTSHESGFGAGFAALVPLGAFALVPLAVARARRGRLPAFGFPLAWGVAYAALWWIGTPHEPRHLLPLVTLVGAPALALCERPSTRAPLGLLSSGSEPRAAGSGLLLATAAGVVFSTAMALRALLYSPEPDLSARPRSYASLYDLPAELVRLVPDGARVANRAGRPYNFPLFGPTRSWRLFDWAPRAPSDEDLDWHQIDFVVCRGAPDACAGPRGWKLLYEGRASNAGFFGAHEGDVVTLHRRQ
jgi:hypothetical protein